MPTIVQIRNAVDTRLANLWTNQILPKQALYASNHNGKYWQGLLTVSLVALPDNPNDANPAVLEIAPVLTSHPTDQIATWADAAIALGATIPMAISIDVYDGQQGPGFVGHVFVKWGGNLYTRAQNFGPEDWRTEPWAQRIVPS